MYLSFMGGALEHTEAHAFTLADGSYRLDGLAETDYELRVEKSPHLRAALGCVPLIERVVHAPAEGVDLEGVPPSIRLSASVNGHAPKREDLERVMVDLVPQAPGHQGMNLDLTGSEEGYGAIQVDSAAAYELRVRPGRYAQSVLPIAALDIGEERSVTLDLKSDDQASTLVVRFVTDKAEEIHSAQFALLDAVDPRVDQIPWSHVEPSKNGAFLLRDLAPGRHLVRVRTDEGMANGSPSHHIATEFEVVLPAKSTVEREVKLELGGRLRMCVKDDRGGFVRAAIELRNARGEKLTTEFYCNTREMNYGCGWYLCEQGLNDHPPLPAGHYECTLTCDGFETEVAKFDLVAGETRTVEVAMHRR